MPDVFNILTEAASIKSPPRNVAVVRKSSHDHVTLQCEFDQNVLNYTDRNWRGVTLPDDIDITKGNFIYREAKVGSL